MEGTTHTLPSEDDLSSPSSPEEYARWKCKVPKVKLGPTQWDELHKCPLETTFSDLENHLCEAEGSFESLEGAIKGPPFESVYNEGLCSSIRRWLRKDNQDNNDFDEDNKCFDKEREAYLTLILKDNIKKHLEKYTPVINNLEAAIRELERKKEFEVPTGWMVNGSTTKSVQRNVHYGILMTTTDVLRDNVRMVLIEEIDRWLSKMKNKNRRCADQQLRYIRDLLSQDMAPWQYIKQTNDYYLIDECAYLCLIVRYQLPPEEK